MTDYTTQTRLVEINSYRPGAHDNTILEAGSQIQSKGFHEQRQISPIPLYIFSTNDIHLYYTSPTILAQLVR